MFKQTFGIILTFTIFVNCIYCIGHYTIVAPKSIRPNTDYQVSLTLHDEIHPTVVKVGIEDEGKYKNFQEVTLDSNATQLVTLRLDNFDLNKTYKLVAEGVSGIVFKNESILRVQSKNVSTFIYTDKAIYKPGETVKFRVLVLDWELRPAKLEKGNHVNVYITDPQKNRIKQWKNAQTKKGVFSAELKLSELPILGDWEITVEVDADKKSKSVEVAEYVLPKFDVSIDSPSHFSAKDDKVRAIVRAKYTYGKFVKGEAIVSIKKSYSYSYYHSYNSGSNDAAIKTIKIDGKGSVEFDIESDLKSQFSDYLTSQTYDIQAIVIEELTGRNQSASKSITLHKTKYKFDMTGQKYEFSPGLPVKFDLTVRHHDDSLVPINDATNTIFVGKVQNRYNDEEKIEYFKFQLNSTGSAQVKIPTLGKEPSFNLDVKYLDEKSDLGYFYPRSYSEPADLSIRVLTKPPTLKKPIHVEVQSKKPIQEFTYQLIARGKVVKAESVAVPNRKYHVFKFAATFEMAPKLHVIVYHFDENELVSTSTDIDLDDDLNNYLKLKVSSKQAKPGQNVSVDIATNPRSYVSILGVDQSVLLLKKNEGLTTSVALDELDSYQSVFHPVDDSVSLSPRIIYRNNYWRDFHRNNVLLFTNAKQEEQPIQPYYLHKTSAISYNSPGLPGPPPSPVAGYAAQSASFSPNRRTQSESVEQVPQIRKEFPETWLWEEITDDDFNGTKSIQKKVPDTITSWVISGFSIDPVTGLGLTKTPRTLEVFQPFFISLNLPYSVKRGEVVAIPAVLFNYLENDLEATVVLHNENNEFEFIEAGESGNSVPGSQVERRREVKVASNNGVSTSFLVKFNEVGSISVKVTATSPLAGDGVVRILHVEPEGVPIFINKPVFVDLRDKRSIDSTLTVDVPEEAVPGSLKVGVNCIGDLLGGVVNNLQDLIRLPTGCGEQNMLKFVPNIVILNYLKTTGQLKPSTESKAKDYTVRGYQRELTYRHIDGSFSSFGRLDNGGSTWLTAFVARSFKEASQHIDVDEKVIEDALEWLSKKQSADGSFPETGQISHKAMQGGSAKGVALTAYTLITFLVNKKEGWKYQETVNKALENVVKNVKEIDDIYALSVASFALQLADHSSKNEVLDNYVKKSVSKNEHKWWSTTANEPTKRKSKTLDVEITSYGLLALLKAGRFADGLPYFRWLLSQRNSQGGFEGTQDTVVGLQALATFADKIFSKENNVQVSVKATSANETHFSVNTENSLVLQSEELPSSVRSADVHAEGKGFSLVQLSYRYNLKNSDVLSAFTLKPVLKKESTASHMKLNVCATFNSKDNKDAHSNMVVLEVHTPSGYTVEKDTLSTLLSLKTVKKIETKDGETIVIVYIDQMNANEELCVDLDAYRVHKVAEQKPVAVRIYDYYDDSRSAREFYTIPSINSCDICEGDECSKSCKK